MVRTWGEKRSEPKLKNHVELVELLGIADLKRGMTMILFDLVVSNKMPIQYEHECSVFY